MNTIVDGLLTRYSDEGEGPLILMLHGWGSNLSVYDGLASALVKKHRIVRFDWPGFGGTQKPATAWGVEAFAAFCEGFCIKLDIRPDAIVGHSMGGQTAVNIVGRGALTPKKLVLLAASAVRPQPGAREQLFKVAAKFGKKVVPSKMQSGAKAKLYQAAGTTDYLQTQSMAPSYQMIIREDQLKWAREIKVPTLLVWGDADVDAPPERAAMLSQAIQGSDLKLFKDAGHFVFLDQPEGVTKLLTEFIDG